jgi:threonyl-tRNA synthetase
MFGRDLAIVWPEVVMSEASVLVTLPDGSQKQTAAGTTIGDFVRDSIGPGLAKAAVIAKANGTFVDLSRTLDQDTQLEIFTTKAPEALEVIRHDAAHIVADAVQRLFPGTQVTRTGSTTTSIAASRSPRTSSG